MKAKRLMSMGLAATLAAALVACGSSGSESATEQTTSVIQTEAAEDTDTVSNSSKSDEPITITYANFNASGGNEETLNKMYEAFHEAYPNITVQIETIAMDDYFTTMQTRIAGGTGPDCFEMNIENFGTYASQGILDDLSGADTEGINQTALQAFQYDGTQYGIPENFSTVVLVYNKDLFDQAGIGYPDDSWTRDDVDAAAKKIRALGDDIY